MGERTLHGPCHFLSVKTVTVLHRISPSVRLTLLFTCLCLSGLSATYFYAATPSEMVGLLLLLPNFRSTACGGERQINMSYPEFRRRRKKQPS
jgi:hypothetical protein